MATVTYLAFVTSMVLLATIKETLCQGEDDDDGPSSIQRRYCQDDVIDLQCQSTELLQIHGGFFVYVQHVWEPDDNCHLHFDAASLCAKKISAYDPNYWAEILSKCQNKTACKSLLAQPAHGQSFYCQGDDSSPAEYISLHYQCNPVVAPTTLQVPTTRRHSTTTRRVILTTLRNIRTTSRWLAQPRATSSSRKLITTSPHTPVITSSAATTNSRPRVSSSHSSSSYSLYAIIFGALGALMLLSIFVVAAVCVFHKKCAERMKMGSPNVPSDVHYTAESQNTEVNPAPTSDVTVNVNDHGPVTDRYQDIVYTVQGDRIGAVANPVYQMVGKGGKIEPIADDTAKAPLPDDTYVIPDDTYVMEISSVYEKTWDSSAQKDKSMLIGPK